MKIFQHVTKKNLLWLVGTLLIGSLGSGLWEAIVKPSMLWSATLMLDLGTLGLSSLRDDMYLDVAKGSYERAGLMLLAMATGIFTGSLTAPLIFIFLRRNQDEDGHPTSVAVRHLRKNWILISVPVILGMIFFVSLYRVSYIIRASNYADQLLRITSPYVSEKDILLLQSELAQISNKSDYVLITNKLKHIASENKISVPRFVIY